jgi:hypothetical protein
MSAAAAPEGGAAKVWLGRLVALLVSTAVSLLLAEAVLRVAGYTPTPTRPDTLLGYRWRPHVHYRWRGEGASSGRTNTGGWVDVEHAPAKPAGVTRILVCGDSYVEALHVPLDSTFHRRLERLLDARTGRRYEVLAMGQSGMGTTQEYLVYQRYGAATSPDIVVLLFILNDWGDNWKPLSPGDPRPYFVPSGDSLALDTSFASTPAFRHTVQWAPAKSASALVALATRVRQELQARFRPTGAQLGLVQDTGWYARWNFHTPPLADTLAAFQLTERILARFADEVRRDGRRFVLVAAGTGEQEDRTLLAQGRRDPTFDPDKTMRFLDAVGARHGFEVVRLTPAFREASAAGAPPFGFKVAGHYGHWNERGHALVAGVLADYFTAHP